MSHSSLDKQFIERVASDLRKCQIDPWLDTEEIRHGQSWLKAIFENGIPTCDSVIVYFTSNSLTSKMVQKEMDSGIISQLSEDNVSFIPYISDESIRPSLRRDLQALQAPVWSESNYNEMLPKVVAEIWRSFFERHVLSAIKDEKVKRLTAELELERVKNKGAETPFLPHEETDFDHIYNAFNRFEYVSIELYTKNEFGTKELLGKNPSIIRLSINLISIFKVLGDIESDQYSEQALGTKIFRDISIGIAHEFNIAINKGVYANLKLNIDFGNDLLIFGLLEKIFSPQPQSIPRNTPPILISSTKVLYSDKLNRFKYWLVYHAKLPSSIVWQKTELL